MKLLYFFSLLGLALPLSAQFYELSQGNGYSQNVYFDLETRSQTVVDNASWDIAFRVGGTSAGIWVNESVISSFTNPQMQVELYLSTAADFESTDTTTIGDRLYNDETSWESGAFNQPAVVGNPVDLGWGLYSFADQTVQGNRTFILKTRDGVYRKLMIESLASGVYTFSYAEIGSSDPVITQTVDKSNFSGKTLAYYSFDDGLLDLEPADWDLLFTRYTTPLEASPGDTVEYTVTGVLQNFDISIAELRSVNQVEASAPLEESGLYSEELTTIGYDWKEIDINTYQWTILDDVVYFPRTADSLYRLYFVDFTGSSSGTSTFFLESILSSSTSRLVASLSELSVYPNPVADRAVLEFELDKPMNNSRLEVVNTGGQIMNSRLLGSLPVGLHQLSIEMSDLPAGHYFVRLSGSLGQYAHHMVKR